MASRDVQKVLERLVSGAGSEKPVRQILVELTPSPDLRGQATGGRPFNGVNQPGAGQDTAGGAGAGNRDSASTMSQLNRQLAELTAAVRRQAGTTEDNTQAVMGNSLAVVSGSKAATAGGIGKTILSFLGGGFGLADLFGKLFGGKQEAPAATVIPYTPPSPVRLEASLAPLGQGGIQAVRYGPAGLPRAVQPTPVTVQVQAIDSRSFLDHSEEIASAVKQALLNSHSLSDVVMEI